jgi:DNA-binding NarL/FixJ family response regulator
MTKTGSSGHVIGVFLLDDHELVRAGVRDFLEAQPGIRVIGDAATTARRSASWLGLTVSGMA